MLLTRYGHIDYILHADLETGIAIINKAMERTIEDKHWQMWLMRFQHMTAETYVSFDDYFRDATKVPEPPKSVDAILADVDQIRSMMMKVGEPGGSL